MEHLFIRTNKTLKNNLKKIAEEENRSVTAQVINFLEDAVLSYKNDKENNACK